MISVRPPLELCLTAGFELERRFQDSKRNTTNIMASPKKTPPSRNIDSLHSFRSELGRRICGQEDVLNAVNDAILRREFGAVPPVGRERCLIFAGPTGVGKTETAKACAELLFGTDALVRFDCGEFRTVESVALLIGDRAGDRGRFGSAFDQVPRGVWLLDELEKANPELLPLLMAMTDPGRLTLASGETLDLTGIYLIATTNLGSAEIIGRQHLPFSTLEKHVIRCIERQFRPELLARFHRPMVYRPMDAAMRANVVRLQLSKFLAWHAQNGRVIEPSPEVVHFLIHVGYSSRLGARPLVDAIHRYIGDAIVRRRLLGFSGRGRLVVVGNQLEVIE